MNSQLKFFLSACFILSLCLISAQVSAQATKSASSKGNPSKEKPNIKTAVFTINLCDPDTNTLSAQTHRIRLKANTGEPISFELKNGNPFKYKYVINTNMVSFFTSETNSFNSIDSLRKKILQLQTNAASSQSVATGKNDVDSLNNLLKKPNLSTKSKEHLNDQIDKAKDKMVNNLVTINSKVNLIANNSLYTKDKKTHHIENDSLKDINNTKGIKKSNKLDIIKTTTLNNISATAQLVSLSISDLNDSVTTTKTELGIEDCLNPDSLNFKKSIYKKRYFALLDDLYKLNQAAIDAGADSNLKSILNDAKNQLLQVKTIINALCNVQLKNYTLPIDVNGKNIDLLKITLERHDTQNSTLIDKYEYQVWLNGGFKLDVSGGAFLTSLVDNKYYTADSVTGGSKKYIYKSNIGKYQIGFGSVLNLSYRTGAAWVRPSLNFGALFSNEQKFQLLAGIGAMLGKEQRVLLHFGLSMGAVTTLENSYTYSSANSPDTRRTYDLGTSNVVPTAQKFQFGHYFGLTYNFGGAKAKTPGVKE